MKLSVTKVAAPRQAVRIKGSGFNVQVMKKADDVEIPVRGFIETQDIKLLVFTNSAKTIVKFELTTGKVKHVFEKEHPFVMWSDVERTIDKFLESQKTKTKEVTTNRKRKV